MTFNEIMSLITPSIVAVLFYSKLLKRKLTYFEMLCHFALFILTTNTLCYAVLIYINGTPEFEFSTVFTMKYSLLATFLSCVVVVIYRFLELNLNIKLKVESVNEKK